MRNGSSLSALLKKEIPDIDLTSYEIFIVQSYLLSEAKIDNSYNELYSSLYSLYSIDKTTPNNLKRFGNITSGFAKNLVSKLRKLLSIASVQFIREKALVLKESSTIKMVFDDFTIKHGNLMCIPMFWTYKVILRIFQSEKIPIVIHAKFLDKTTDGYKVIDNEYLIFDTPYYYSIFSISLWLRK